jgi:ankyrin repeat protein
MWGKDPNKELLGSVYRQEQPQILKWLKKGAAINRVDEDGRTILMHAILADKASVEVIMLLIQNGANVKLAEPAQQWTPLHFAARDNRADIVKVLLENKAEVDARDVFGNTPLWRAVMNFKGDDKAIRLLLSHGADKNLANKHGVSPLSISQTTANPGMAELFN